MKSKLLEWKKEIKEVSNCVCKVTLIHNLGICIEKTGTNLELLEKEVELSAIEMNKQIKEKLKTNTYDSHLKEN